MSYSMPGPKTKEPDIIEQAIQPFQCSVKGGLYLKKYAIQILSICFLAFTQFLTAQIIEKGEIWVRQSRDSTMVLNEPMYHEINKKEFLDLLDKQPSFGLYKDNYFITGIPLNLQINQHTANAMYQVSLRQRLTKTILPFNSFLLLTYTQKSFWNIYAKSSPFNDNNYNPGLALVKPIIYKDKFIAMSSLALEHESNGRAGLESRSWNYLIFTGVYFFDPRFSMKLKLWPGILSSGDPDLEGDGNPDLFKYRGYGSINLKYSSLNDKFGVSAIINPRTKIGNFNSTLEFNFKLNPNANQYLFVQWFQGYGESLLDYTKYSTMVRAGICIKSPLRVYIE